MKLIAINLLLILAQIDKRMEVSTCGQLTTTLIPFLINAHSTHLWPWHVAIYHKSEPSSDDYQCGGTLISSKSIITAGHCVSNGDSHGLIETKNVSVSLGKLYLDDDSVPFRKVSKIVRHSDYNAANNENDIAIIQLSTHVTFNNYVQPICLWKADKTDLSEVTGRSGVVLGWGLTETGRKSNLLQRANLQVIPSFKCLKSNRDLFGRYLSDTNFCAGTGNGTSVCSGDSGGSLSFEENGVYHIRGIVSLVPMKANVITQQLECDGTQYAIFTDVAKFLPWITESLERMDELLPSNTDTNYIGCFRDQEDRSIKGLLEWIQLNTIERCVDLCRSEDFKYAGAQFGSQCFCGNKVDPVIRLDERVCSTPCSGNFTQKCGNEWAISLYKTGV